MTRYRRWIVMSLAGAGVLGVGSVTAKAEAPRRVAGFYLPRGDPAPELVGAVKRWLAKADEESPQVEWLVDATLQRELRAVGVTALPMAEVLRCGSDLTCLAELGKKVAADEVALVRLTPAEEGEGITLAALMVDIATAQPGRKLKLTVRSEEDLESHRLELFGLLGIEPSASPVAEVGALPGVAKQTAVIEVGAVESKAPLWRDRALFQYLAMGLGGAAVVTLAVGIGFGGDAQGKRTAIAPDTDQRRAVSLAEQSNSSASTANGFFVATAVLAVLGGGAWGWQHFGIDWLISASASTTEKGARAALSLSF